MTVFSALNIYTYADPPIAVALGAVGTDLPAESVSGIQALNVMFDGSSSTADTATPGPGAGIVDYRWDFGDDSGVYGPTRAIYGHTYYPAGTHTATLTITDILGQEASDSVVVTVIADSAHGDPVAVISATPSSGPAPLTVQFDATSSTIWSELTNIFWDFGDGETGFSANPRHTYSPHATGTTTYTVTLTVYNRYGHSDSTSMTIDVGYTNILIPTITSISPQEGQQAGKTSINVTGENLLTVTSASFIRRSDGTVFSGAILKLYSDTQITVISPPGSGVCDLVLNSYAGSSTYPRTWSEFEYKPGPTAYATVSSGGSFASTAAGAVGQVFTFHSSGSTPGVTYSWNFGDGTTYNFGDLSTSNDANPTHIFQSSGVFTVTLTVTDSTGLAGFDTCTVYVGGSSGPGGGWDGGTGSGGGGNSGGWGGPGGIPYDPPPGTPPPALWIDATCSITSKFSVATPKFTVDWTSYRRADHVQFDAKVTVLVDINAYAAYIGGISTSADGGFPYPDPTDSTVRTLGYNASTASITGGSFPSRANIVLNGLFTQRLFAPGATVPAATPTYLGGVVPAGTAFRMRVRAPLTYDIAFASLGFLNSNGYNTTDSAFAYLKTDCSQDLVAGWRVGSIGSSG